MSHSFGAKLQTTVPVAATKLVRHVNIVKLGPFKRDHPGKNVAKVTAKTVREKAKCFASSNLWL